TKENRRMFEGSGEIILPSGEVAVSATAKYMKLPVEQIVDGDFTEEEWVHIDDNVEYVEY
ncbi:MAG: PaaI family thioesterase, partial [Peptostreptococcaceae bacterium]